jgi:hypothetical protein
VLIAIFFNSKISFSLKDILLTLISGWEKLYLFPELITKVKEKLLLLLIVAYALSI